MSYLHQDRAGWARALEISREAVDLYLSCDVIDLHVETYSWTRAFGYDVTKRHGGGFLGARLYGHADLPRLRDARVTGGVWALTTNPFRLARTRLRLFDENLSGIRAAFERAPEDVALVATAADYRRVVDSGRHAAWLAIQGGNALSAAPERIDQLPPEMIAVTLVHLMHSPLGRTSAPSLWGSEEDGLTPLGHEMVKRLNARRILVDLAHINRQGFFDAVAAHDRSQPLIDTHTGLSAAHPSWRNIDDEQARAIADTGGTIGVMYQSWVLGDELLGVSVDRIVDHLEQIIRVAGEEFASLGSDWDGLINPPRDMPTCLELPRLVQKMLDRRWSAERIRKILGGNFLRVVKLLRG